MVGTSDDAELMIHCTSNRFHEYQKIWSPPNFRQKLNIKRDKIKLFDPYAIGLYCEINEKIVESSNYCEKETVKQY